MQGIISAPEGGEQKKFFLEFSRRFIKNARYFSNAVVGNDLRLNRVSPENEACKAGEKLYEELENSHVHNRAATGSVA